MFALLGFALRSPWVRVQARLLGFPSAGLLGASAGFACWGSHFGPLITAFEPILSS
jgi:hypothetical protein